MATDYTVIFSVRQRFGDNTQEGQFPTEQEAPFVGREKDFPFSCPNVNRAQSAVLQFESLGVQSRNIIRINGTNLFGGLTAGPAQIAPSPPTPLWKTHNLIVQANVLNQQNTLHIESVPNATGNHDDFIIDNVVLFFKTRDQVVTPVSDQ